MSARKENHKPDTVLDHEYDGIQEFDNRLPNWWLWSFYLACIFSVGFCLMNLLASSREMFFSLAIHFSQVYS